MQSRDFPVVLLLSFVRGDHVELVSFGVRGLSKVFFYHREHNKSWKLFPVAKTFGCPVEYGPPHVQHGHQWQLICGPKWEYQLQFVALPIVLVSKTKTLVELAFAKMARDLECPWKQMDLLLPSPDLIIAGTSSQKRYRTMLGGDSLQGGATRRPKRSLQKSKLLRVKRRSHRKPALYKKKKFHEMRSSRPRIYRSRARRSA